MGLYVRYLAKQVVDNNCSLIDITSDIQHDTQDGVYNYARVLCHYASEFRDAWGKEMHGKEFFGVGGFCLFISNLQEELNILWKHLDCSCKPKLFCLQCFPTNSFGTDLLIPKGCRQQHSQ